MFSLEVKNRYNTILFVFVIVILAINIFFTSLNYKKSPEFFDYKKVPTGYVISIVGINEYYDPLDENISDMYDYRFYEVGIANRTERMIYKIVVPRYAITLFRLGSPTREDGEETKDSRKS